MDDARFVGYRINQMATDIETAHIGFLQPTAKRCG